MIEIFIYKKITNEMRMNKVKIKRLFIRNLLNNKDGRQNYSNGPKNFEVGGKKPENMSPKKSKFPTCSRGGKIKTEKPCRHFADKMINFCH